MIQRIQSIYLVFVSLVSIGLVFLFNFWKEPNNLSIDFIQLLNHDKMIQKSIGITFIVVGLLAFVSLISYTNRKLQLNLNRINILINLILLGLLAYMLLNISGEMEISEKGIGSFLPFVSIIGLVLANRAIKKDENLVKSVDRLR